MFTHKLTILTGDGARDLFYQLRSTFTNISFTEMLDLLSPRQQVAAAYRLAERLECETFPGDYPPRVLFTQSPYVVTALCNCIQGHNAIRANPSVAAQVREYVTPISYDDVMLLVVDEFLQCKPAMDDEYRLLGVSDLDEVSDETATVYDALLALELEGAPVEE